MWIARLLGRPRPSPACTCPTDPLGHRMLDGCARALERQGPEPCAHNGGCPVRAAAGIPPGCCRAAVADEALRDGFEALARDVRRLGGER